MDSDLVKTLRARVAAQPYDTDARLALGRILALSKSPEGAESFIYATRLLMQSNRWGEALNVLRQLLGSYPDHTEAMLLMARIFAREGATVAKPIEEPVPLTTQIQPAERDTPAIDAIPLTKRKSDHGDVLGPADLFIGPDSLPTHSILDGLSPETLKELLRLCLLVEYDPAGLILDYGDKTHALRLILDGVVSVERQENGENVELARIGSGEVFGEIELLSGLVTETRVVALTDCQILEIRADVVQRLAESDARVWTQLWELYTERLLSNVLRTMPVFAPMSPNARRAFIDGFVERAYGPGIALTHEGDKRFGLSLILEGEAVVTTTIDGDQRAVRTLGPGEMIGIVSICLRRPAMSSVVTLSPCRVMEMPRVRVQAFMAAHPELAERGRDEGEKRRREILEIRRERS